MLETRLMQTQMPQLLFTPTKKKKKSLFTCQIEAFPSEPLEKQEGKTLSPYRINYMDTPAHSHSVP